MKKIGVLIILLVVAVQWASSAEIILSVNDFSIESGNPDYRYIGKGISRLVAGELRKTEAIRIIEREKLKKVLDEQNLTLSGVTDEASQIELGKLLSADFIVIGEIIDMAGTLLFSVRLVDTSTGEVVWQDELTEELAAYDYIGSFFAQAIIQELGLEPETSTTRKIAEKETKNEETVVRLSEGIDAFDRDDEQKARKALSRARALDPDNETAEFYLNKLTVNTAKFKIITEPYYSYQNPAYLGELKVDKLFLGTTSAFPLGEYNSENDRIWQDVGDDWVFQEGDSRANAGYFFPLKRARLGIGLQYFSSNMNDHYKRDYESGYTTNGRNYLGGAVGIGYSFGTISAGISIGIFNENNLGWDGLGSETIDTVSTSVDAGLLYHTMADRLTLGTRVGFSNASTDAVDPVTETVDNFVPVPLFWENSAHFSFENNRSFLIVKQVNDIYVERGDYFIRILPLAEHYLSQWLSLRGGIEGSMTSMDKEIKPGFGVVAGITLRIPKYGLDFDVNLTYRQRPSRLAAEYLYDTLPLVISISKEGLLFRE